jgi:hypothetical protein
MNHDKTHSRGQGQQRSSYDTTKKRNCVESVITTQRDPPCPPFLRGGLRIGYRTQDGRRTPTHGGATHLHSDVTPRISIQTAST